MDKKGGNREEDAWTEQEAAFFRKVDVPLGKDKEAIWDLFSEEIDTKEPTKTRSMWMPLTAAAAALLLVSTIAFCKFHRITINSQNGEHLAHELPDGSIVELNAATSIAYAPYWWSFDRAIKLEGEAFFEVEKGSSFVVHSKKGKTEVLGTSFNIFARDNEYRVLCTTGRVKVTSQPYEAEISFSLAPTEMAVINKEGKFTKQMNVPTIRVTGWKQNKFYFADTPIDLVFKELERQYDIEIKLPSNLNQSYSAFLEKKETVETILNIICVTFDLQYTQTSKQSYKIERTTTKSF